MLGQCDITVTSDPVTPGDLSVQVVSGLGMSVKASPAHPFIITTTVTAYNILHNYHQVRERVISEVIWKMKHCLYIYIALIPSIQQLSHDMLNTSVETEMLIYH